MRYHTIPNTNLSPSVLSLGTGSMGATIDRETSMRMLDAYLDHGGNFIDTAKVYNDWIPGEKSRSEKVIGAWVKERGSRAQVILATKGGHPELDTMNIPRLSPQEIIADLDASLNHLQVDTIDLYWLHRDDPSRPVAEIMDTMVEQVRIGKIRCFGCSNWRLDRLQEAQDYSAKHGFTGFVAVQNLWNLAKINVKNLEDPTLVVMDENFWKYHAQAQLAAIPFSSQANGLFQKMENEMADRLSPGMRKRYLNDETEARFKRLQELKSQTGLSTGQIVLGYLTGQPFPTFPVIGPQNMAQLEDSLTAADVVLTADQIEFLTNSSHV